MENLCLSGWVQTVYPNSGLIEGNGNGKTAFSHG